MTRYSSDNDFQHGGAESTGVLLMNLGTPDAPTPQALRRYLAEFLWDPRVVEVPRPLWWLILHGIILRFRPARSARAYARIWEDTGSPLLTITQRQAAALRQTLQARCPGPLELAVGMRYGKPSIREGLESLRNAGVRRLLLLPLYPQYSASTTASTLDAVSDVLKTWRWVPELRFINHYHDDPGYIQACAARIQAHWAAHPRGERLLLSFHGIPKRYLLHGDPYHCECHKTGRLIAEALGLEEGQWQVSFQSRFGREEWLQPYTDHVLQAMPGQGVKSVDVFCPGFAADCLETLEEIAMENKAFFLEAGGEHFGYVPALNDSEEHIAALADLVMRHMQGWPEASPDWNGAEVQAAAAESRERALAMGADR